MQVDEMLVPVECTSYDSHYMNVSSITIYDL